MLTCLSNIIVHPPSHTVQTHGTTREEMTYVSSHFTLPTYPLTYPFSFVLSLQIFIY
jgi:hypothetical protein